MIGRRLRIGLVCPYSWEVPGGVQSHVVGLARHLRESGHAVSVLAPGTPPEVDGLDAHQLCSSGGDVPVPYNGGVARVSFGPLSGARVRRWLRHGAFDLLHLHEPVAPNVALLALWATDVPVVATFHAAHPRSRSRALTGAALQSSIDKIDVALAVSPTAREVVRTHLGRDAAVVPNGLRLADFSPRPVAGAARAQAPRLVFLGRLDEARKGLSVLLRALPALRREFPELEVVLAGPGRHRLPTGVRHVGVVSETGKAALLRSADVFVAPHRERESFGIVLLEAMASGAPVVAADLPAFADLLARPGEAALGELFPAGDTAALAAAVARVLRRPDRLRVARARDAARHYDWSVVGGQLVEVYRGVLDAAPVGRAVGR